jgi:hypothetical protein
MENTELLNLNFEEANNYKHKYGIFIEGIDYSVFTNRDTQISITDELVTDTGSFTPKSLKLVLEISAALVSETLVENGETMTMVDVNLKKEKFTSLYLKDYYYDDEEIEDWIFTNDKIVEKTKIEDLIKINDDFILRDTINDITTEPFIGKVRGTSVSYENGNLIITLTIKNSMISAYNLKYKEDKVLVDWFISNNSIKEKSLTHRLAEKLGYDDTQQEIDDLEIKNEYLVVPFFSEVEDVKIIETLAELVRSYNGILKVEKDKIYIKRSELVIFPINQIADSRNILVTPVIETVYADYKSVKLEYDKYVYAPLNTVWYLAGAEGNIDNARIYISANVTKDKAPRYKVEWQPSGLIQSFNTPIIEATNEAGDPVTLQWEYEEISLSGGKIVFWNDTENEIFIKKFIVKGVPVKKLEGNEIEFTKVADAEDYQTLELDTNTYIQTPLHANYYAQLLYKENCIDKKTVSFGFNHCLGFLQSGSNLLLRHSEMPNLDLIVTKFTHDYNNAELTTETFENFVFDDGGITETENSNVDYGEIQTSNIISENPVLSDDKPSKPLTFELNARYNGFSVLVGLADEENIKGIYVYMKKSVDVNWSKELFSSTNFFIAGSSDNTYEIKLTTFNFSGIESDETEIKFVVPLKPSSDDISYPIGQSPGDLEEASNLLKNQLEADILTLQNSDLELEGRIETNASNITQTNENITLEVNAAVTSLRDNEISSLQSSIDLNAEGITLESSTREAEITAINDPTNLVSRINIAPEGVKIEGNSIKLGSGLEVDSTGNVFVNDLSADTLRIGTNFYADSEGLLQIQNLQVANISGLTDDLEGIKTGDITLSSDTIVNSDFKVNGENVILNADTTINSDFKVNGENVTLNANTTINSDFKVNGESVTLNANTTINSDFKVNGENVILNADTEINGTLEIYKKDASDYGMVVYDGSDLINSNSYVNLINGQIDLYERGIGDLFYKTRGIKKKTVGTGSNGTVVDLKNDSSYGTKTDWKNTTLITYLKSRKFAQNRPLNLWTEAVKSNDNVFTLKIYEEYLKENYNDNLSSVSNLPAGDYRNYERTTVTYTGTTRTGTDFHMQYSGIMKTPIVGYRIEEVSENYQAFVKLDIYKGSSIYKTLTKNYAGDVYDTSFSFDEVFSFSNSQNMHCKITFFNGEYNINDTGSYSGEPIWLSGNLTQKTFVKTTVANTISSVYFEASEIG